MRCARSPRGSRRSASRKRDLAQQRLARLEVEAAEVVPGRRIAQGRAPPPARRPRAPAALSPAADATKPSVTKFAARSGATSVACRASVSASAMARRAPSRARPARAGRPARPGSAGAPRRAAPRPRASALPRAARNRTNNADVARRGRRRWRAPRASSAAGQIAPPQVTEALDLQDSGSLGHEASMRRISASASSARPSSSSSRARRRCAATRSAVAARREVYQGNWRRPARGVIKVGRRNPF